MHFLTTLNLGKHKLSLVEQHYGERIVNFSTHFLLYTIIGITPHPDTDYSNFGNEFLIDYNLTALTIQGLALLPRKSITWTQNVISRGCHPIKFVINLMELHYLGETKMSSEFPEVTRDRLY